MVAVRYRRPVAGALLVAAELVLGAGVLAAATASPYRQADWVRSLVVCGAMWFVGDSAGTPQVLGRAG